MGRATASSVPAGPAASGAALSGGAMGVGCASAVAAVSKSVSARAREHVVCDMRPGLRGPCVAVTPFRCQLCDDVWRMGQFTALSVNTVSF